jgi:hypothetical protein
MRSNVALALRVAAVALVGAATIALMLVAVHSA